MKVNSKRIFQFVIISILLISTGCQKQEALKKKSNEPLGDIKDEQLSSYNIIIGEHNLSLCVNKRKLQSLGQVTKLSEHKGPSGFEDLVANEEKQVKLQDGSLFTFISDIEDNVYSMRFKKKDMNSDILFNESISFASTIDDVTDVFKEPVSGEKLDDGRYKFTYISADYGYLYFLFSEDKLDEIILGTNLKHYQNDEVLGTCHSAERRPLSTAPDFVIYSISHEEKQKLTNTYLNGDEFSSFKDEDTIASNGWTSKKYIYNGDNKYYDIEITRDDIKMGYDKLFDGVNISAINFYEDSNLTIQNVSILGNTIENVTAALGRPLEFVSFKLSTAKYNHGTLTYLMENDSLLELYTDEKGIVTSGCFQFQYNRPEKKV